MIFGTSTVEDLVFALESKGVVLSEKDGKLKVIGLDGVVTQFREVLGKRKPEILSFLGGDQQFKGPSFAAGWSRGLSKDDRFYWRKGDVWIWD